MLYPILFLFPGLRLVTVHNAGRKSIPWWVTEAPHQQVPNQKIIAAKSMDYFFVYPNIKLNGVLGMGFGRAGVLGENSVFESLIAMGEPEFGDPVFALLLDGPDAEFIIGGTDTSKFSGDLTYHNVSSEVSILGGAPCLRLTRTRYRVFGRSRWILSWSMETSLPPLRKQFLTRAASLSLLTTRLSLISITISPSRFRLETSAAYGQVRMSQVYLWGN